MSIDFARFLEIWLFTLHMPEEVFWETMTPARIYSLYSARFRATHRRESSQSLQTGEKTGFSLYSYLTGGG